MPRETYVMEDGHLIPKRYAMPKFPRQFRSDYPSPQVIRDGLDDLRHPATGRPVDSKRKFSKITRDHGCVEIGTAYDNGWTPKPEYDPVTAADVAEAAAMVEAGHKPGREIVDMDSYEGTVIDGGK